MRTSAPAWTSSGARSASGVDVAGEFDGQGSRASTRYSWSARTGSLRKTAIPHITHDHIIDGLHGLAQAGRPAQQRLGLLLVLVLWDIA